MAALDFPSSPALNQVYTANAKSWRWDGTAWVSAAGSGGWALLEQHTASNQATLDFTTFISSTYDAYLIELLNVQPVTDGVDLRLQCGTGSGPTYGASTHWFANFQSNQATTSGAVGAGSSAFIQVFGSAGNFSANGVCGEIRFYSPQDATFYKRFVIQTVGKQAAGTNFSQLAGGGQFDSTTAVTALRFLFSSGNINAGTIRIYGVQKV